MIRENEIFLASNYTHFEYNLFWNVFRNIDIIMYMAKSEDVYSLLYNLCNGHKKPYYNNTQIS